MREGRAEASVGRGEKPQGSADSALRYRFLPGATVSRKHLELRSFGPAKCAGPQDDTCARAAWRHQLGAEKSRKDARTEKPQGSADSALRYRFLPGATVSRRHLELRSFGPAKCAGPQDDTCARLAARVIAPAWVDLFVGGDSFEGGVVGCGGDFAEGLSGDGLWGVGVGWQRNMVDISGENELLAACGDYVSG